MNDITTLRPVPDLNDPVTGPYWEAAQRGELVVQRCAQCGTPRWYPSPVCRQCWSFDYDWHQVPPTGTLYTWVRVHQPFAKGFEPELPYVVAIVEVEGGVRIVAQARYPGDRDPVLGEKVSIYFDAVAEDVLLPFVTGAGGAQ